MHPRKHGRVICQFVGTSLGEVVDMSAGGMCVTTAGGDAPKIDDVVKVKLIGISSIIEVRCRIAWVKELGNRKSWSGKILALIGASRFEVGLEFVDLTDEARTVITEVGACAGKNETIRPDIERFRADAA